MQPIPYAILGVMLATAAPGQEQNALNYLNQTREGLIVSVKDLTTAQWNFKPAPDRWSIAEVVEHLAVTEEGIESLVDHIPQAPAPAAGRDAAKVDAMVLAKMPDRSTKARAPQQLQPTGRWTPAVALEHFNAACDQLAADLRHTPDLRRHVIEHPAFGPLDGYEWILAAAGHAARHTEQILEVKADPHFPR